MWRGALEATVPVASSLATYSSWRPSLSHLLIFRSILGACYCCGCATGVLLSEAICSGAALRRLRGLVIEIFDIRPAPGPQLHRRLQGFARDQ